MKTQNSLFPGREMISNVNKIPHNRVVHREI